ncbi:MAG: hypothetical protein JRI25_28445 [Deltaproteobacteria bacterium]|nr:hypothetical protein [Deltaproteobacteria bacterium]
MITLATTGQIVGGWEYVWAAYIVTWVFLAGYSISLWLRWRQPPEEDS